ncbi:ABC transporter permease [Nocardioides marmoriginsengisoli]|uniref:ABC transporter permease n=1 Tax=Nocardioides marmoriginsengisoli TaxID=661483 RepID=A0A3N0CGA1_9ACTN|nr:ABC transporter permease [Nocardioides marmoriginsengisoli]RNL62023.1 ABC transporter permease [Nocardioides marmoriginsengisoli]
MSTTSGARLPSPVLQAARLGIRRGYIEMMHSLTNRADQIWIVVMNGVFVGVLVLQRNSDLADTGYSLAVATLPGLIGMNVVMGEWMGTAQMLAVEREDGTLLRAKSTPHGMLAYLVARVTLAVLNTALGLVIFLVAGLFLLPGLNDVPVSGWLMLLGVFLLGMLATMPWGAVVGASVKSAGAGFGLTFLPMIVLIAISGIFYPITGMPDWLHPVAQVFPVYWLGAGMREALLPDAAAAAELGGQFHTLTMFGVLGGYAVLGLLVAPRVLRAMARKESGSVVEGRKAKAMQGWG